MFTQSARVADSVGKVSASLLEGEGTPVQATPDFGLSDALTLILNRTPNCMSGHIQISVRLMYDGKSGHRKSSQQSH